LLQEIQVKSGKRNELIDVTAQVEQAVSKSNAKEGICVVYCPHTTAAVTINENADLSVKSDIISALNKLVPEGAGYSHAEGNSDSHIKASLMGNSRTIIVQDGKLLLGQWEGIFFCEFDGPRTRRLLIKLCEAKNNG